MYERLLWTKTKKSHSGKSPHLRNAWRNSKPTRQSTGITTLENIQGLLGDGARRWDNQRRKARTTKHPFSHCQRIISNIFLKTLVLILSFIRKRLHLRNAWRNLNKAYKAKHGHCNVKTTTGDSKPQWRTWKTTKCLLSQDCQRITSNVSKTLAFFFRK